MPRLTLRRPHRVSLPSLQHPRVLPNPYVHRTPRPYYAARNRANPGWATNCACDAERRVARAYCGPLLPHYHKPLRPQLRRTADTRSHRRLPSHCPSHVMRSSLSLRKPHSHHPSSPCLMKRSMLRCAPPSHSRHSRLVWQEVVDAAPHPATRT